MDIKKKCLLLLPLLIVFIGCDDDEACVYCPGEDITIQLSSDLENGKSVKLGKGTFYVSEVIDIENYPGGTIEGAGKEQTIIKVTPGWQAMDIPIANGQNTVILAFMEPEGDVVIKSMTISVEGDSPAEGHTNPWLGYSTAIDNIIVVGGENIAVSFIDLRVLGESTSSNGNIHGYNIGFPLIASAHMIPGNGPIDLTMTGCEVNGYGIGVEYYQTHAGTGIIENNIFSNAGDHALWLGWGDTPCKITVRSNTFSNISKSAIYKEGTIVEYCFEDNTEDGVSMVDDCAL